MTIGSKCARHFYNFMGKMEISVNMPGQSQAQILDFDQWLVARMTSRYYVKGDTFYICRDILRQVEVTIYLENINQTLNDM